MKLTLNELEGFGAEGSLIKAVLEVHGWAHPFDVAVKISDVTEHATVEQLLWVLYKCDQHYDLVVLLGSITDAAGNTLPDLSEHPHLCERSVTVYNYAKKAYKQGVSSAAGDEDAAKTFDHVVRTMLAGTFKNLECKTG